MGDVSIAIAFTILGTSHMRMPSMATSGANRLEWIQNRTLPKVLLKELMKGLSLLHGMSYQCGK